MSLIYLQKEHVKRKFAGDDRETTSILPQQEEGSSGRGIYRKNPRKRGLDFDYGSEYKAKVCVHVHSQQHISVPNISPYNNQFSLKWPFQNGLKLPVLLNLCKLYLRFQLYVNIMLA